MRHGRTLDLTVVVPSAVADTRRHGAPRATARPSPTAVPAPTYPANVMDVADFSPLEVETYYVDPVGTDMRVFYSIPADGWMSWFGAFKPGKETDPPNSVVGFSVVNVTNTGSSPSAAFAGLALPVRATSSFVAVLALSVLALSVLARILDDFMTVPRSRPG